MAMDLAGTMSDREFGVARAVYMVTRNENGVSDWKAVAECR